MILNNHNIRFIKDRTPDYFTFIIKPKQLLDPQIKLVESTDGTIGIRIPKSDLMCEVAKSYGPYIATSANLSGENSVHMVKELEAQMGENLQKAKLIIDGDCSSSRESSTVLDLTHEPAIVIRQGSGVL
jgi:tRNA A37 threonylcarbamoyladenosine synthetase subunit TsaC/SUA5/YrdC